MTDQLLETITRNALKPAMALLPPKMGTPEAYMMLLAIGLQESRLSARCQVLEGGGRGPAHGLWQNERGGGVLSVLTNPTTRPYAIKVCSAFNIPPDSRSVWDAIETNDVLAAAFARLILYADPMPLPGRNDESGAWSLYAIRAWRPGRPHPETWPANFKRARDFIFGEAK